MTNKPTPTPEDIQEACDRLNEVLGRKAYMLNDYPGYKVLVATTDLIAERNAERQRVSEIAKSASIYFWHTYNDSDQRLKSLILPDPEPTPEEVLRKASEKACDFGDGYYANVCVQLAAQGYEITKIKGGDNAG